MTTFTRSAWEFGQADNVVDCRNVLANASQYLKKCFFEDEADIDWLVHQQSHFVDEVLQFLWQKHLAANATVSLIAVGGYGRGELHPHSDVDLLVLLDDSVADTPPTALSDFLTQLWDIGLEIGHSVRTIGECRQQAENNITIATNLLEARFLSGNPVLFDALQQLTVSTKTWDNRQFYERKKLEQLQRHHKYNDTGNNLEPNLKESPGGLRDIQVINWVARQHFDVRNLQGLKAKGFLAESEFDTLQQSRRFLWRVRFALHHQAGRKHEKLLIDHQRELAKQLGYLDTDSRMAVEHFMKDYYRAVRAVSQMNALLLQLFEETIILADDPSIIEPINCRFQLHNGYLETINPGIFAYYPYALLEVFLILQQHPQRIKGIRAATIRQIHAHLHLIDDRFRADIKNRNLFMELIRQPKDITHEFRRMNQLGVLGAYLPEFGRIVGQMQHDLFHAYTVDEHTLFLVRNLRRFSYAEFNDEFPFCSEVFQQLPKSELLYIAGIYHDIAKGRGGNHSILGVKDAEQFCTRHNLSEYDTKLVTFLVRHHLAMSTTAQKCDLEDPEVIQRFAKLVRNVNRLNYLYLLTVADIRATNSNLWNGWRDSLLKQLYHSTRQWLEHTEVQGKSIQEKSYQKYQQALDQLIKLGWSCQDVTTLWQQYDLDYFFRRSVDEIVWQTNGRLENKEQETLILVRPHNNSHTLELCFFTPDRRGLFAATTACLEQLRLNILDAKLNVSLDGYALNTFIVNGNQQRYQDIIDTLHKQLTRKELISGYAPQLAPRRTKLFKTEPIIKFSTNLQQNHSVMELYTHDRPGLLSTVAQIFLAHQIQVINAKMVTLGDQVEDVFFITNNEEEALNETEKTTLLAELKEKLILQANSSPYSA